MSSNRVAMDTPQENRECISELSSLIHELSIELDLRLSREASKAVSNTARSDVDNPLEEGDRVRVLNKYGGLFGETAFVISTTRSGAWIKPVTNRNIVFKRAYNLKKF